MHGLPRGLEGSNVEGGVKGVERSIGWVLGAHRTCSSGVSALRPKILNPALVKDSRLSLNPHALRMGVDGSRVKRSPAVA